MVNEKFIQNFSALIAKEKQAKSPNTFRIRSYQKVIKIISELKTEITSSNDVAGIPGIGAKTIEKINTILEKGQLDGLDISSTKQNTFYQSSRNLEMVTGMVRPKPKAYRPVNLRNCALSIRRSFSSKMCLHHQH